MFFVLIVFVVFVIVVGGVVVWVLVGVVFFFVFVYLCNCCVVWLLFDSVELVDMCILLFVGLVLFLIGGYWVWWIFNLVYGEVDKCNWFDVVVL